MSQMLLIGAMGMIGIFSRWGIDSFATKWIENFPVGILTINCLGSFVAGLVYVFGNERSLFSTNVAAGLLVGFCGGFTTFSAYSLQSFLLFERGEILRSLSYLIGSPVLGVLGAYLGILIARG